MKRAGAILLLMLIIAGTCFGAFGDYELTVDGAKVIWNNNSWIVSIAASASMTETTNYIWPVDLPVAATRQLLGNTDGTLEWQPAPAPQVDPHDQYWIDTDGDNGAPVFRAKDYTTTGTVIVGALSVDNTSGTDAVITMNGTSDNPQTITYKSDTELWIVSTNTTIGDGDTVPAGPVVSAANSRRAQANSFPIPDGTIDAADRRVYAWFAGRNTSGGAGIDYTLTFDGESNDGILTWMEDEDYLLFNDDLLMTTAEKIQLRDTAIGIYSQADSFMDIFADGGVRIGDSSAGAPTNYLDIEPDGTIEFNGNATVWDDYVTPITRATFGGAANDPTLTKLADDGAGSTGVWALVFGDGDEVLVTIQMPHSWKEGTTIYPHIHWMATTDVDPADNFDIDFEYWWADIGEDFPANTTLTNVEISTGANTQWQHQASNVTAAGIDGSGHTISSVLLCRIERVAAAGDNYAGGIVIKDFDVHFEKDTVGSRAITSK